MSARVHNAQFPLSVVDGIPSAPARRMADVRKQDKQIKKDPSVGRDVRTEVEEQVRDGSDSQPLIKKPNRDRARGDWDRTGDHHDEGIGRD
jgi:hypothetical protein